MDGWKTTRKLGEGAFGSVYVAKHEQTGEIAALKKVSLVHEHDGIPGTALREVSLLQQLTHHPNVVHLKNVMHLECYRVLWLLFEWCDYDLKQYMRANKYKLSAACIKSFTRQMLSGLAHVHSRRVLHRDLKPQNILIQPEHGTLKLADFGLARAFTVPLRTYTHEVVTLWYRAPEILLGTRQYACPVDVWSIGTIIPEMVTGHPLFPGDSEIDEIFKIFGLLGTPNEQRWHGVTTLPDFMPAFPQWPPKPLREVMPHEDRLDDAGVHLVQQLLAYKPEARLTAKDALNHPYFDDI